MLLPNFQLTDAAGNFKTGKLVAGALLALAAAVSALFTLYVNTNNDKLQMVLSAKDAQVTYIEKDNNRKEQEVQLLLQRLDSCRSRSGSPPITNSR